MTASESDDADEDVIIIQNAIYCSICKKYLVSCSTHDYVSCAHAMVDGGQDYFRKSICLSKDDFGLDSNAPFEDVADKLLIQLPNCDEWLLMRNLSSTQLTNIILSDTKITAIHKRVAEYLLKKINFIKYPLAKV
jgi:hypothetical protein